MKSFKKKVLNFLVFTVIGIPVLAYSSTMVYAIDNSKITDKVIAGYQMWFCCEGDGSPRNSWVHWGKPEPRGATVEVFPDVRDYSPNALFNTRYANNSAGEPVKLFSSYPQEAIDKHFEWMKQYGIDGVAIQRFASNTQPGTDRFELNKQLLVRAKKAAEQYDRLYYVMYDLSGFTEQNIVSGTENDWKDIMVKELNITSSPNYAKQDGKNVVCLWGVGVSGRKGTPDQYLELINWFKEQGCYVIIGVPKNWRGSATNNPMEKVYRAANMISPWAVGSVTTDKDIDASMTKDLIPDRDFCKENGIDYQPVMYAGFAWSNWNGGARNQIPRRYGEFMWRQAYDIKRAGIPGAYIAMFDEYDEGTAIAKQAEDSSMIPQDQYFLTTSADGKYLSSDFYLRLAGAATKMIEGLIPETDKVPIPYSEGPVFFRSSFEKFTDAQLTWANTIDGDSVQNVKGPRGIGEAKCEVVTGEQSNRGHSAIKISGKEISNAKSYAYFKAIEVNIPVKDNMILAYSFFPTNELGTHVVVDAIASDGSSLESVQAVDNDGNGINTTGVHGTLDQWKQIQWDLGKWMNGKTITKLVIKYENEKKTGDFGAYIDDLVISTEKSEIDRIGVLTAGSVKNAAYARSFYTFKLFDGASDTDYQPELDGTLNREQVIKMILTMLGKKKEAEQTAANCPFTDVSDWAKPYVGYAFKTGMAKGASDTYFDANAQVTERELLTFYLRALGYDEQGKDLFAKAGQKALEVGLYKDASQILNLDRALLRDDMVGISYNVLSASRKGVKDTLFVELVKQKIIDQSLFSKEYDIQALYNSLLKPPATLSFGTNIDYNLMTFVLQEDINKPDACTLADKKEGQDCRRIPPKHFMYCNVADSYIAPDDRNVTFTITFFDDGSDNVTIHYNSLNDGSYKPLYIKRTGTNKWRTESVKVDDANFMNKQNQGADFRIGSPDLFVKEVKVEKTPQ